MPKEPETFIAAGAFAAAPDKQGKALMEREFDFEFEVGPEQAGTRLDTLLSVFLKDAAGEHGGALPGSGIVPSRSKVEQWIAGGFVKVDLRTVAKPSFLPAAGALISVWVPPPRELTLAPDPAVVLQIIFEDDDVLVLDKPAGMVVHPGAGQETGTLVHGLLAHLGEDLRQVGDALRPGIVHRLDKDTSGIMAAAKTEFAYQHLVRQFQPPRTILRRYLALTRFAPKTAAASSGTISLPISRHRTERKKMTVSESGGKEARTEWTIKEELAFGCLLELSLQTGRTHQIRVHLQRVHAPIIGDPVYGTPPGDLPPPLRRAVQAFNRQALHAHELSFLHPRTGKRLAFCAPVPEDMARLIDAFRGPAFAGA